MKNTEYQEAVYLANLINSGRVPDWSVSHDGIKSLAKALILANGSRDSLVELVDRRTRVVMKQGGSLDGSDGRYARARESLKFEES